MKRWLSNRAAALSLVFFVATAALWMWSYHRTDYIQVYFDSPHQSIVPTFQSGRGTVLLGVRWIYLPRSGKHVDWIVRPPRRIIDEAYGQGAAGAVGFAFGRAASWQTSVTAIGVPCWFVVLLSSVLPGTHYLRRRRRRHRAARNRCQTCGYDLRATPDRCPECGVVPDEAAA